MGGGNVVAVGRADVQEFQRFQSETDQPKSKPQVHAGATLIQEGNSEFAAEGTSHAIDCVG
jgi:hypothetical protein